MGKCKSFNPQINEKSKVLILGSMPGVKSLEMQEYYAFQYNRFWAVMGYFCNYKDLNKKDYITKIKTVLSNGYALWDVIGSCYRDGALDFDIKNETPNEISKLLKKYPNIEKICLNGNKAYSVFKKYFPELIKKYNCIKLPSTSPANARYSLEKLIFEWEKIKI